MAVAGAESRDVDTGVQLAEIVAAIALAADLGLGQPLDHMLRACVIADRFAEHLELSPADRETTYWVTLFTTAGCTGVSFELSAIFGDDIAFRAGIFSVGASNFETLRYVLGHAGAGRGMLGRTRVRADLLRSKMAPVAQSLLAHCGVSAQLAARLSLGDDVVDSLGQTFERWDGRGMPGLVGGDALLMPIQIGNLANLVEVLHREQGVEAACGLVREFRGRAFDPMLVDAWCDAAVDLLKDLEPTSSWERVVEAQPAGRGPLTASELDDALELLADYADLKSPWFIGHSRGVASLATAAAHHAGIREPDVTALRRAALVHDVGRNGVPNTIWDKPGPLTAGQLERVRLHSYYTDRVLHRASKLAALASVASAAHERSDGTGYPRGIAGGTIPRLGRLLAAADMYHAMIEERPHRTALSRDSAARELRRAAVDGQLDGSAVDAVLAAAGHPSRRKPTNPANLTSREVEVLVLAARGATTRAIAHQLGISPKTAGNHVQRLYEKIGVHSRAEAAMFAMRHHLLATWETGQP